jgi:hypothetical protein
VPDLTEVKSSSHGIRRWCPSIAQLNRVLSRGASTPSVSRCNTSHMGRPRGFSPPRRVSPRMSLRVYCASHTIMGFVALHASQSVSGRNQTDGPEGDSRQRLHPSKNSTRKQPFRITTAVALLTLPFHLISSSVSRDSESRDLLPNAEAPSRMSRCGPTWPKPCP